MSKLIETEHELREALKSKDGIFVLFYASWCPFSQRFLSIYEKMAKGRERHFVRVLVDDKENVCDTYGVEVYPTVIYFKDGQVSQRLDGAHHVGLNERQLAALMEVCGVK